MRSRLLVFVSIGTGDSLFSALVRVRHSGALLGRVGRIMADEAGVRTACHELCGGVFARLVFISPSCAFLLFDLSALAGICQLLSARLRCQLDRLWRERNWRLWLASGMDRRCGLRCGDGGQPLWTAQCGVAAHGAVSVTLPNLPLQWRGRTAALVSDLHLGMCAMAVLCGG